MSKQTVAAQKASGAQGQFGELSHAANNVQLDESFDWGEVHTGVGSRTPWGSAQDVSYPAPGIAQVSCAGHGGIKLSPARNAAVPAPLRNSSGWYEEDCESHIVAWVHPEAFPRWMGGDLEAIREDGRGGVVRWFPDEYEKATGDTIPLGESHVKDKAEYDAANAGRRCLYTVGATEHPDYPGMVVVTTDILPTNRRNFSRHMIPLPDYQAAMEHRQYGAASVAPMLPSSAVEVPEALDAKPEVQPVTTINVGRLTAVQRARAEADLDKRWRDRQGRAFSLREDIAAGKFNGKTVTYSESGKPEYHLRLTGGESRIMPVSKAVWDAFDSPDERTQAELMRAKWRAKNAAVTQAHQRGDRADAERLGAEEKRLRDDLERLEAEEREARRLVTEQARRRREAADKLVLDAAYRRMTGHRPPLSPEA